MKYWYKFAALFLSLLLLTGCSSQTPEQSVQTPSSGNPSDKTTEFSSVTEPTAAPTTESVTTTEPPTTTREQITTQKQTTTKEPAAAQPTTTAKKPAATQPTTTAKKPAVTQPTTTAKKPAATQPTTTAKKPAATQPQTTAKKPAATQQQATTKKPAVTTASLQQEVFQLVNAERKKQGLPALRYGSEFQKAADIRAEEIVKSFSHTRPNGNQCFTIFEDLNLTDYWGWGENIAYGYPSAQSVMDGWMNSNGHRANILSKDFTGIAVGVYVTGSTYYWVQLFVTD